MQEQPIRTPGRTSGLAVLALVIAFVALAVAGYGTWRAVTPSVQERCFMEFVVNYEAVANGWTDESNANAWLDACTVLFVEAE